MNPQILNFKNQEWIKISKKRLFEIPDACNSPEGQGGCSVVS